MPSMTFFIHFRSLRPNRDGQFPLRRTMCLTIQRSAATMHAVDVNEVHFSFGGGGSRSPQVLAGTSIRIPRGTVHMILGPNGSGKSTLLRIMARLLSPDSGTVHADSPTAFVFQNPDHQVVMPTVAADVAFGLGRYALTDEQVAVTVHHALERVGMAHAIDRPISSLSGGQKQRVAIAGALAENPRLLLLDELTTYLDGHDQRKVLQSVRNVVDRRPIGNHPVTAVWVTHRLEEVQYADGVSIMEDGKVVFQGDPGAALRILKKA